MTGEAHHTRCPTTSSSWIPHSARAFSSQSWNLSKNQYILHKFIILCVIPSQRVRFAIRYFSAWMSVVWGGWRFQREHWPPLFSLVQSVGRSLIKFDFSYTLRRHALRSSDRARTKNFLFLILFLKAFPVTIFVFLIIQHFLDFKKKRKIHNLSSSKLKFLVKLIETERNYLFDAI